MTELQVKWPLIVEEYEKIYFNYIDLGNYTMFRMCCFKTLLPRYGFFVAIEDIGAFFFGMHKEYHKDYVAEKLRLGDGDSGQVADFMNAQAGFYDKQQGHYYEKIIRAVEPFGKIGEEKVMPWTPEITMADME